MKEAGVQRKIINQIKKLSECKAVKYHNNGYGEKGTPDILGCYRGRFFAIEVKAAGGKTTPLQEQRLKEWKASGALACVAGPDFELDAWLSDEV